MRRRAVTWAISEKSYTQRRACGLVGLHPKTYRYATKRPEDGALRSKVKELASQRRRFEYRRLGLLLARQGIKINHKKLYRLYREERLTVRSRGGRKRALGTRAPMTIPQASNLRWSIDFVADRLASSRRFQNPDRRRRLHAGVPRAGGGHLTDGSAGIAELDRVAELRGYPCMVVSDNGTERTSNAILAWQQEHASWSFNGRLCDECLNEHLFASLKEARQLIEEWRIDYNTNRPHSSLNELTPIEFVTRPITSRNSESKSRSCWRARTG